MAKKIIHIAVLLVLLSVGLFGMVRSASADGVYQTERLDLLPVDGAPLRSGAVVNIHANGPSFMRKNCTSLMEQLPTPLIRWYCRYTWAIPAARVRQTWKCPRRLWPRTSAAMAKQKSYLPLNKQPGWAA